jgi:hypothetical protein
MRPTRNLTRRDPVEQVRRRTRHGGRIDRFDEQRCVVIVLPPTLRKERHSFCSIVHWFRPGCFWSLRNNLTSPFASMTLRQWRQRGCGSVRHPSQPCRPRIRLVQRRHRHQTTQSASRERATFEAAGGVPNPSRTKGRKDFWKGAPAGQRDLQRRVVIEPGQQCSNSPAALCPSPHPPTTPGVVRHLHCRRRSRLGRDPLRDRRQIRHRLVRVRSELQRRARASTSQVRVVRRALAVSLCVRSLCRSAWISIR